MAKFDEKEIRHKLEIISQITPTQQSTGRALEKVRRALISEEERDSNVNLWSKFKNSRITRLAAAAVIIIAISLLIVQRGVRKQEPVQVVSVAKSPAELLTLASLRTAYRRGGIDALEKQCDEAVEKLGRRETKVSIQELFAELNGT